MHFQLHTYLKGSKSSHEVYLTLPDKEQHSYWSRCPTSPSSFPNHYWQFQWNLEQSSHYWWHFILKCHTCVKLFFTKRFCNSQFRGIIFLSIILKWLSRILYDSCILYCYSYKHNPQHSNNPNYSSLLKTKRLVDWIPYHI